MNKITGILLIIGALPLPIEYYDFLRIFVSIMAALNLFRGGTYLFIPILVLFNPILPIYLYSKILWVIIDILSGIVFLGAFDED